MDNDEIILNGDEILIRKYNYLPYSYYRIVDILRNYCNAELCLTKGYKEGRYNPHYKNRYQIRDIETQEIIKENVHLDDLRYFFAEHDIPLVEPLKIQRNSNAEYFMKVVKEISNNQ